MERSVSIWQQLLIAKQHATGCNSVIHCTLAVSAAGHCTKLALSISLTDLPPTNFEWTITRSVGRLWPAAGRSLSLSLSLQQVEGGYNDLAAPRRLFICYQVTLDCWTGRWRTFGSKRSRWKQLFSSRSHGQQEKVRNCNKVNWPHYLSVIRNFRITRCWRIHCTSKRRYKVSEVSLN